MKTINQIAAYTNHCSFGDVCWNKILEYCRTHYTGGKLHRNSRAKTPSSYDQFIDWIDNGFGSGDFVEYGNTAGIICESIPGCTKITAYLDFNGNIIDRAMEILEPERLAPLSNQTSKESIERQLYEDGLRYSVRQCGLVKALTLSECSYAALEIDGKRLIGQYVRTEGTKHLFALLIDGNDVQMDCWIDGGYSTLEHATQREMKRIMGCVKKMGLKFDEKEKRYVKRPIRTPGQVYWYLNESFNVQAERDGKESKHNMRYEAGNYFTSANDAFLLALKIQDFLKDKN